VVPNHGDRCPAGTLAGLFHARVELTVHALPPPHAVPIVVTLAPPLIPMIRGALAVVAGVLAGSVVVWAIDLPGSYLHPLPVGLGPNDRDALVAHAGSAPLSAKSLVAVAWGVAPLVGGWLATRLAGRSSLVPSFIVGALFLIMNAGTLFYFPLPFWLSVACLALPPITSFAGGLLANRS
jgi:hypothetical protein